MSDNKTPHVYIGEDITSIVEEVAEEQNTTKKEVTERCWAVGKELGLHNIPLDHPDNPELTIENAGESVSVEIEEDIEINSEGNRCVYVSNETKIEIKKTAAEVPCDSGMVCMNQALGRTIYYVTKFGLYKPE